MVRSIANYSTCTVHPHDGVFRASRTHVQEYLGSPLVFAAGHPYFRIWTAPLEKSGILTAVLGAWAAQILHSRGRAGGSTAEFKNARSSCTILIAGRRSSRIRQIRSGKIRGTLAEPYLGQLPLSTPRSLACSLILRCMQVGKLGAATD